jgi:protein-tyrosine-phosphatase
MSSHDDVLEVVFVCSGNRARSPLAEALFRRYSAGAATAVSSAGTLDLGPVPALPHAVKAGRRLGIDLSGHRAKALREGALSSVDLVLGFEPAHVSTAITQGDASADKTFLLNELLMLLHPVSSEPGRVARARAMIADADARRVRSLPHTPALFVADPVGQPLRVMHRTASDIDRLVRELIVRLFGDVARPSHSRRTR